MFNIKKINLFNLNKKIKNKNLKNAINKKISFRIAKGIKKKEIITLNQTFEGMLLKKKYIKKSSYLQKETLIDISGKSTYIYLTYHKNAPYLLNN